MSTKQPLINQHVILHEHYGNDCCLCRSESNESKLRNENAALRAELQAARDALDIAVSYVKARDAELERVNHDWKVTREYAQQQQRELDEAKRK